MRSPVCDTFASRMWRSLHGVVVVALSLLVGAGCNSALEEYRCTNSSDCAESLATIARCEPSGHCSFLDTSCFESGFRFGESSGDESGQCVSDEDTEDEPDAGTSLGLPPTARIIPTMPGTCGTSLTADGSTSEAFDGATIQSYEWTLRDAADGEIDRFSGAGQLRVVRALHRLGGNHSAPIISPPSYNGLGAFRGNMDRALRTSIFQSGIALKKSEYRLVFAAGLEIDVNEPAESVTANIVDAEGQRLFSERFDLELGRFAGYEVDVALEASGIGFGGVTLLFEFDGVGHHWLDNVALVDTLSGDVVSMNQSAESGDETPWLVGDGTNGFNGLAVREIPQELRESEVYAVTLQVTDSNGQRSSVVEIDVIGEDCIAAF